MGLFRRQRTTSNGIADDRFSPTPGFRVEYGEETRFITDSETQDAMRTGRAQFSAQEQYFLLESLVDESRAYLQDGVFTVPAEEIARLDDADASILSMPEHYSGRIRTTIHKYTAHQDFSVALELQTSGYFLRPQRRGPLVVMGDTAYRASVPLLRALRAVEAHGNLEPASRTENVNIGLVAELKAAAHLASDSPDASDRDDSFRLDLGPLERFQLVTPRAIGLLIEPQSDGSLTIEPHLGPEIDADAVQHRWHQLDRTGDRGGVLRIDSTLVPLEPKLVAGISEVRRMPRIAADQVADFERAPASYFDPDLVDMDSGLNVRVRGLGVIVPLTFNQASQNGISWFGNASAFATPQSVLSGISTIDELTDFGQAVNETWGRQQNLLPWKEQILDVSAREVVKKAISQAQQRLNPDLTANAPVSTEAPRVTVGWHLTDAEQSPQQSDQHGTGAPNLAVDYSIFHRQPFAHQRVGIEWMSALIEASFMESAAPAVTVQGALLADDMGLGKTLMVLAALSQAIRYQTNAHKPVLPMLAVMPLALLENWQEEVQKTFGSANGPFTEVLLLHGANLDHFRPRGARPETEAFIDDLDGEGMVMPDRIKATLYAGKFHGTRRFDKPGSLVLTTYETLRRYQVSFSSVEWGVAVFDEAQVTKNPETLVSRAVKALNAKFKLLATGTPVENSLRDFWSLMDTAQPGLLGSWASFNRDWALRMSSETEGSQELIGAELRALVGNFMLRRNKEDHIDGLPNKYSHPRHSPMPSRQVDAYDEILHNHRLKPPGKGAALSTLHALGAVSLHPWVIQGELSGETHRIEDSARSVVVQNILDEIRASEEKAIIFLTTKTYQRALAMWITARYGIRPEIVNGDTKATGPGDTRINRIRSFENRPGFNVIIMSPLAAGVGLTVVGANHAIHLERHWNPAKEAQATDRIYRIGQTRDVHVHIPIAIHPEVDSFDVNLDGLLRDKVSLRDAVVVPEIDRVAFERRMGL